MKYFSFKRALLGTAVVLGLCGLIGLTTGVRVYAEAGKSDENCTTILDSKYCNTDDDTVLLSLLKDILGVFEVGVGVMGTIGIIICGVMVLTAGDNEEQLRKAKKRLVDVVIGVIMIFMLAGIAYLLLPTAKSEDVKVGEAREMGLIG